MQTRPFYYLAIAAGLFILVGLPGDLQTSEAENWPQWRGPLATGVAPRGDPPLVWNEEENKNILWKTKIPGRGHSTPIVWDDRVYLTTAIPIGKSLSPRPSNAPGNHDNLPVTHRQRFMALAVNRTSGKILWQKNLHEGLPQEQGHYTASLASSAPVTDGNYLYACFGSFGLYCLDLAGELVWKANLGKMQSLHGHGEGSSPVLYRDTLILNWDHEGQSFLVAFDKMTGRQQWKIMRDEVTSWATPIIIEHAGMAQVIVSGTKRLRGHDLTDGRLLWGPRRGHPLNCNHLPRCIYCS